VPLPVSPWCCTSDVPHMCLNTCAWATCSLCSHGPRVDVDKNTSWLPGEKGCHMYTFTGNIRCCRSLFVVEEIERHVLITLRYKMSIDMSDRWHWTNRLDKPPYGLEQDTLLRASYGTSTRFMLTWNVMGPWTIYSFVCNSLTVACWLFTK